MIKLFKYLKWHEWLLLALLLGIVAGQVWCTISLPTCTFEISQYLLSENLAGNWQNMVISCMKMLGFTAGVLLTAVFARFIASYLITTLLARVRAKLFHQINDFSTAEVKKFSIPSLITRTTNDITQLQQVLTTLITMGIHAPLMAIFAIVKIVEFSSQSSADSLSIVNIVSVIAIAIVVFVIMTTVLPKFKKYQKIVDSMNKVTRENLTGIKVVRANNAESAQETKFENVNTELTKTNLFVSKIMSLIGPALTLIMQGTSLAIVWIVGLLAQTNPGVVALMSTFTQYSMFIIMSFTSLSMLFMFIPRGIISGKRINEILDTKLSLFDGKGATPTERGSISFKNVFFRYPDADADVLEDISFDVKKGETVAFIGSTGSGKSTLINLIPRFYDCSQGQILINGEDITDYTQEELHNLIGYVPQKGLLFSGTVESNIKYGKEDATEEELKKAIDISQSNFVYKFKDGLAHPIAQGGNNVSGGQKQRLSIARAIIKDPEFLIFDDSFSALDFKTDKIVRRNLNKHFKDTTKIIVAQRIGTIMNADQIIVLNEGKMVGKGTHKELLKTCEVYKEIALSQLSKEELA
ncbi:MAG: ABC transporter ATP-binding protein [Clostridia bacterium]|nr:ABC transporter ATP-binding protein [Clostridia bacterium]